MQEESHEDWMHKRDIYHQQLQESTQNSIQKSKKALESSAYWDCIPKMHHEMAKTRYKTLLTRRRISALEFEFEIGCFLQFLVLEKKFVQEKKFIQTFSKINKWLARQGFRIYFNDSDDDDNDDEDNIKEHCNKELWNLVVGEDCDKTNLRFTMSGWNYKKIYDLSRFNQMKQLNKTLTSIHEIPFCDKEYFPVKLLMKRFIEYLIKLVVCRKLQESIFAKKFKLTLPIILLYDLQCIVLEYYFEK